MAYRYIGRFAPSPTGPLHFGSLLAAVASYADARHHRGEWLVRIEDVDQARCRPHMDQAILATLHAYGMRWDQQPLYQTQRQSAYADALLKLEKDRLLYRCDCSRRSWATTARIGREGPLYPGICRHREPPVDTPVALRVKVDEAPVRFHDRIFGDLSQDLAQDVGDFVVRRIDGFTAYQLAVVVDDADQGVTDVVRGADLLWSTPRQVWLQNKLKLCSPRYAHVPLARDTDGRKLSKRLSADPVDDNSPMPGLLKAWAMLGQQTPRFRFLTPTQFWDWAIPNWKIERVPVDQELKPE
jgi:glutamyl-Q tRNA(Asp) synthetase